MVVKILSASASFNGVGYNEKKVSSGAAELVAVSNFGIYEGLSGVSVQDYKEYLTQYSTGTDVSESRVKNPQFHAIISCEGREYDSKQLTEVAQQYLEKMGYQQNPTLIYFHSDTDNNHVHIVSTRINESGKKINDSFEHRRSQAAIKEILMQDMGHEIKTHVEKAMSYSFSSEAQFKLLLEAQGITVKAKDDSYNFIKYGSVGHEIPKATVTEKVGEYQEPDERIKQLAQLFKKYKPALDKDQFSDLMKTKFGVELVFHMGQGKDTPYGYTIIDHAQKQVFKGSQVMKLSSLLAVVPRADRLKAGGELITVLAENEKLRYRDFKGQLSKLGLELNAKGEVRISGEEVVSFSISRERMKQVLYNDRLSEAQKFTINSSAEAAVVAKVLFVDKKELADSPQAQGAGPAKLRNGVFAGELLAHGQDHYQFNEANAQGYYATIKTDKGEVTLWGVDIGRAIQENGVQVGQQVGMEFLGSTPVKINTKVRDEESGNWIEKEIETKRNTWKVDALNDSHYEQKESREQARQIVSDKLNSLLSSGKDLGEIARENNYSFAKKEGETYLVDKKGYAIYNIKDLTDRELDFSRTKVYDLDREYSPRESVEMERSSGGGFGQMLDVIEYMLQANSTGTEADNKKKRKRNQ